MSSVKYNEGRYAIIHLIGRFYAQVGLKEMEVVTVSETDEKVGDVKFTPLAGAHKHGTLDECLVDACMCYRRDCLIEGKQLPMSPPSWVLDAGAQAFVLAKGIDAIVLDSVERYIDKLYTVKGDKD